MVADPLDAEGRRASLDGMDFVVVGHQELCQIGAVMAGDAGDDGFFMLRLG